MILRTVRTFSALLPVSTRLTSDFASFFREWLGAGSPAVPPPCSTDQLELFDPVDDGRTFGEWVESLPLDSSVSCPVDGITPRQSNLSTAQAIKMGSWGVQRPGAGSKPKTLRKPSQPWDGHGTCPSVGERLTGVRSGDLVTGKHRLAAHPALLHSSEMRETQHLAAQAPGLRADNRGPVDLGDLEGRESHLAFRTSSRRGQAGT